MPGSHAPMVDSVAQTRAAHIREVKDMAGLSKREAEVEVLPMARRLPPGPDTPPLPTIGPQLVAHADAVRRRVTAAQAP